jgi:exonuclease III
MESLRIATINVNGFRQSRKHYEIANILKLYRLDILCIQESQIATLDVGKLIESKLKCKALWNFGTYKNRDSSRYIFNNDFHIQKFDLDIEGRFLCLDLVIKGKSLRVICMYAPNNAKERKQIFLGFSTSVLAVLTVKICLHIL